MSEKQNIDEILKEFQKQKEDRDAGISPKTPSNNEAIDFAKSKQEKVQEPVLPTEALSDTAQEIKPKQRKSKKEKVKKERKKIDIKSKVKKLLNKKFITIFVICIAVIAIAVGGIFGIKYAKVQSQRAYLKPYEQKYEDVDFPTGILEEYCEAYAQDQTIKGNIKIDDIGLDTTFSYEQSSTEPYAEKSEVGCQVENYVVYLNDNSLEQYYKDVTSYNELATGFMTYSDLYNNYSFKIVGAFYTNTKADDDNGYIFPYNVTEKQSVKSKAEFMDRLQTRFLYSTSVTLTTADTLLTVSCPTDFETDFRFVVVGVLRESTDKLVATEKKQAVHYPDLIYKNNEEDNPYSLSSQWYPEIILTGSDGNEQTKQQTIADYQ